MLGSSQAIGTFLGLAIHDTSQVVSCLFLSLLFFCFVLFCLLSNEMFFVFCFFVFLIFLYFSPSSFFIIFFIFVVHNRSLSFFLFFSPNKKMGAALTYNEVFHDEIVLKTAAITKLTRNLFLAGVIPLLVVMNKRWEKEDLATAAAAAAVASSDAGSTSQVMTSQEKEEAEKVAAAEAKKKDERPLSERVNEYVPLFVLGFMGMSVVRTVGDGMLTEGMQAYGVMSMEEWKSFTKMIGNDLGGHYLLGTAMASVGLSTSASALKGVGVKPFIVGMSAAGCVATTAFVSVSVLTNMGVMV